MRIAATLVLIGAAQAQAQEVRVVTDIPPIGGMVADLLDGIGTPEVLVGAGVSPHDFSFRPSDATLLSEADHVIWRPSAMGWHKPSGSKIQIWARRRSLSLSL